MNKVKEYLKKNKFLVIIFIVTIFVLTLPNLQGNLVSGDDYIYHLARIQSMADSMKNGIFPVKINTTLANNFGYASSMFYPDLFLYIPSLLLLIFKMNLMTAYKIFVAIFLCFMFYLFYQCFYHITENRYAAILGTIFLMLSRVMVLSLYHRFALGEFLGYAFILPCLVGMYDYLYKEFKSPQYLVIGFFGLMNTHLITGLITLCFCLLIFIINIKVSLKNRKGALKLVGCALLVLLISLFFWAPMIEQLSHQELKLSTPWTNIGGDDYTLFDYLSDEKYSIGLPILIMFPFMLYGMFSDKIGRDGKRYFIDFLFLSILLVCPFMWEKFSDSLNIIQFRWRLLGIITTVYGMSATLMFRDYIKNVSEEWIQKVIFVILAILVFFTMKNFYYNNYIDITTTEEELQREIATNSFSLGGGAEYLPSEIKDVHEIYQRNPNMIIGNDEMNGTKYPNLTYCFNNQEVDENNFVIPFVYYYGYVANITLENGEIIALNVYKSNNGFVEVEVPEGLKGEIRVWYHGTRIQKISLMISSCTILCIFVFIIIKKVRKR